MASAASVLSLGTAQLGQTYGIANRTGQPSEQTANALLKEAWRGGIRYFDTAQAYARSEEILGRYLQSKPASVAAEAKVITKLHPDARVASAGEIETLLERSWRRLGGRPIWGVLLHRETQLDDWDGPLGETLLRWREQGRIGHLGVSVASPEGMARAIELREMQVVQAPASAFDRRMRRAGLLTRAEAAGMTVFLRSVFLQGLMLLAPQEAARRLPHAAAAVECLDAFCAEHGIDRLSFALGYARHRAPNAFLVIGSETSEQVADNCRLVVQAPSDPQLYARWDATWTDDDPLLVDPSRWDAIAGP